MTSFYLYRKRGVHHGAKGDIVVIGVNCSRPRFTVIRGARPEMVGGETQC